MKLNHLFPVIGLLAFAMTANAAGFDYEGADAKPAGSGWDAESEIVDNPYKSGNTSSKCTMVHPTEAWGVAGEWMEENTGEYKIVADFFVKKDCDINCYHAGVDANKKASLKGGKWNRVVFDFSALGSSAQAMVYFGQVSQDWYVDNIQFVKLSENVADYDTESFSPDPDVAYTFGRVKIGGGGFVSGIIAEGSTMIARTDVGGAYIRNHANCSWDPILSLIHI